MTADPLTRPSWNRFWPISTPLFVRTARDYLVMTLLGFGVMTAFHWLVVTFLPLYDMRYKLRYIRKMPSILKGMIGQDIDVITSTTGIGSFAYMHPVSLAVIFAFAAVIPSGVLVGQIDRGTIELTLATPTSRKKYMATTIVYACLAGAALIASMLLGSWIGVQRTAEKLPQPYDFAAISLCALNLYALYLAALGWSVFFSAIHTLRGPAVGWAFGICVAAYLIHFLSEWWTIAQKIAWLGPMYYFRPIKIVSGYNPTDDILLLGGVGAGLMLIGALWFSRRDIAVV